MEIIKKNKVVIAVVLTVLILVLIRVFGVNHFKNDSKKMAEPSLTRSNIITVERAGTLLGNKLFIYLDRMHPETFKITKETMIIPSDSILNKKYLNKIRKHEGPVILYSTEGAVSARIWMVLSQMGCRNIYILASSIDNEVFKNKFRPDSLLRPEL